MLSSKAILLARNGVKSAVKNGSRRQGIATVSRRVGAGSSHMSWALTSTAVAVTAAAVYKNGSNKTLLEMPVIMAGEPVKEPDTGILFPPMVNGFTFMGCGVRIKYIFVKVYAVGSYLRPEQFKGLKDDVDIEKALLDPNNHRTIRIVMNRSMTMDKYNDAIVESLTPRMKGQDLDKLEEFKKLNPAGPLEKDTELLMTIRGDTLLYKNASGNVGTIHSEVFTRAMLDVYYGKDPVSPPAKAACVDAIKKL